MQRSCELTIFLISPLHKSRLYNAGYQTTADLEHVDAAKLSKGNIHSTFTVNILKLCTLVICQNGLDKQCRPRSGS